FAAPTPCGCRGCPYWSPLATCPGASGGAVGDGDEATEGAREEEATGLSKALLPFVSCSLVPFVSSSDARPASSAIWGVSAFFDAAHWSAAAEASRRAALSDSGVDSSTFGAASILTGPAPARKGAPKMKLPINNHI